MTDSQSLIERLRSDWPDLLIEKYWTIGGDAIEESCREIADAIEELDRHLTLSGRVSKTLSERIGKLEADNVRLRDGFKEALSLCYNCGGDPYYAEKDQVTGDHLWTDCPVCRSARAALQGNEHD